MPRLVFAGSSDFAVPTLAALAGAGSRRRADPAGPARGPPPQADPDARSAAWAAAHGIAVQTPRTCVPGGRCGHWTACGPTPWWWSITA
jgi:methionyl-tRNA formyltransferase